MDTLAHRLKTEREARHLTQSALAKLVSPKKRQSLISNLEAGAYPSSPFLPEIAYVLGLHAMWLKTGIGPKYINPPRDHAEPATSVQEPPVIPYLSRP